MRIEVDPSPVLDEEQAHRARELVEQISPLLSGQGCWVQGAVLADLVSLWLAGIVDLEAKEQERTRMMIFASWSRLVIELIPDSIEEVMSQLKTEGTS